MLYWNCSPFYYYIVSCKILTLRWVVYLIQTCYSERKKSVHSPQILNVTFKLYDLRDSVHLWLSLSFLNSGMFPFLSRKIMDNHYNHALVAWISLLAQLWIPSRSHLPEIPWTLKGLDLSEDKYQFFCYIRKRGTRNSESRNKGIIELFIIYRGWI